MPNAPTRSTSDLGQLRETYRFDGRVRLVAVAGWTVAGGLGVHAVINETALRGWSIVVVAAATVVMLSLAVHHLVTWIGNRRLQVSLHHHGLLVRRGRKRPTVLLWGDLAVCRQLRHHLPLRYTVVQSDGYPLIIDTTMSRALASELGEAIIEQVTRTTLPAVVSTLDSGGTVSFGPVVLSPSAVTVNQSRVPWPQAETLVIRHGRLHLTPAMSIGLSKVYNVPVLIAACRHLRHPINRVPT